MRVVYFRVRSLWVECVVRQSTYVVSESGPSGMSVDGRRLSCDMLRSRLQGAAVR